MCCFVLLNRYWGIVTVLGNRYGVHKEREREISRHISESEVRMNTHQVKSLTVNTERRESALGRTNDN